MKELGREGAVSAEESIGPGDAGERGSGCNEKRPAAHARASTHARGGEVFSHPQPPQPLHQLPLLAVPNVSEGRNRTSVGAIATAFTGEGVARLLDVHTDPDHHRAVLSLAGHPGTLASALAGGVAEAVRHVDVGEGRKRSQIGQHPHVGAVDVVPLVYLHEDRRGAACAEALLAAHLIGSEAGVPVLMYGELAQGRTRAELRRGGVAGLARRMRAGELRADFGPQRAHERAGVTLVAARGPLVAFNLELAPPAGLERAREIAAAIREGGPEGLPGLRAIGVALGDGGASARRLLDRKQGEDGEHDEEGERVVGQVSMNVERPHELPLVEVVAAVRRHAEVRRAEIVGLVPRAALEGFPGELQIRDFDPARQVIENALGL